MDDFRYFSHLDPHQRIIVPKVNGSNVDLNYCLQAKILFPLMITSHTNQGP